ncbi:MAG: TIGR02186 family protein [Aestuariivirgaceae bacterium]
MSFLAKTGFACALLVVTFLAGLAATPLRAESVEADLGTHNVAVKTDFAGVKVLMFGAVDRPAVADGQAPRDIIIVVRGPEEQLRVRRKARVAGIWVNAASATFDAVPGYYAIVYNRPAGDIASSYTLREHGIGFNSLQANLILSSTGFTTGNVKDYASAVVRVLQRDSLYQEILGGVGFSGQRLFRAEFELPANVPLGDYKADVFIFRAGEFVAKSTSFLRIEKRGIERFIYELAHQQPFVYGILSVLAAILAGMGAAAAFGKK